MPRFYHDLTAFRGEFHALAFQERDLLLCAARVTARRAVGPHHAMARHLRRIWIMMHDIPNRPRGIDGACALRNLAIGHNAAFRNFCDDSIDPGGKCRNDDLGPTSLFHNTLILP